MSEAAQKTAVETQKPETFAAKAYAAKSATSGLSPFDFKRRVPLADDVQIEILYCGVCHSDLHLSRNEWKDVMPAVYPVVPGHEIVGVIDALGEGVVGWQIGQRVGLGFLGGHCGQCQWCRREDWLSLGQPIRGKCQRS